MEFNATVVVSAISFIVFIIIMNSILYKPILNIIEERENFINSNLQEANKLSEKAGVILEEKNQQIKNAHKQAKETINAGVENSKINKLETISKAVKDSKDKIENEKSLLLKNEQEAKETLKNSVADLAKDITEKLLGYDIQNVEYNQELVDEAINNA